jgi:hypothetical protein
MSTASIRIATCGRPFLRAEWARLPPADLLLYFKSRRTVQYFSLPRGAEKHLPRARRVLNNEFEFNNECHRLPPKFDWRANPSEDLEWLILLHKFYYLRDLALAYDYTGDEAYAMKSVQLIDGWIRTVAEEFIDSQVTGRRLQQWILAYQYLVPNRVSAAVTPEFLQTLLESLNAQATYLCMNLTPQGNHRTIELYALFLLAVMFPELAVAEHCLAFSRKEILQNMREDLLADGVQKELSTDYHHTVLKNYLRIRDLAHLNAVHLDPECDRLIERALDFSLHAHKPDGMLPAINDGDVNSYLSLLRKAYRFYPNPALLFVSSGGQEGSPPCERSRHFPASGYCILRSDWRDLPYTAGRYLFFDCGALGQGSHGHYDLLNVEFAAYGRSLIVDPGRYTYSEASDDGRNWRHYFKGTAGHNTITVDGCDQIHYRCGAPEGRQPSARVARFISSAGFDYVHGQAVSPEYPAVHDRKILFLPSDYCLVIDQINSTAKHHYDQYWHLAPFALDNVTRSADSATIRFLTPNLLIAQPTTPSIHAVVESGYVSPEYGLKQPAPIIRASQSGRGVLRFHTLLFPFAAHCPFIKMELLPVRDFSTTLGISDASVLRIRFRLAETTLTDHVLINEGAYRRVVQFGNIVTNAQLLWVRQAPDGSVLGVHADGVGYLRIGARSIVVSETELRLSTMGPLLNVYSPSAQHPKAQIAISELAMTGPICGP